MCPIRINTIFLFFILFGYGETNKITIMKCCKFNEYVGYKGRCKETNISMGLDQMVIFDKNITATKKKVNDLFELVPASSRNFTKDRKIVSSQYNYYLIENGTIMLELPSNNSNRWAHYTYDTNQFCIDAVLMKVKTISKPEVRVWTAPPKERAYPRKSDAVILVTELLVSSVFMVLVLVVYCLLPELRNLCGMMLMAYVASTLGAFLTLATLNLISFAKQKTKIICLALTFVDYYFFLSSFCWMNVMSIDIWWTFRGYAKARPIHRRGEKFKFGMYCLYAWGLPLVMTVGMGLVDRMDLTDKPWFVKPDLQGPKCFLEGDAKFVYLYVPMSIIIVINWVLFLMTAFNIWRLSRGTAVLESASSRNSSAQRTHRQRFLVYLKLSVIMGINWVLEVISYFWPEYRVWYLTDTYNMLIGVSIFLIFVCKKNIFKKLKKRLRSERAKWSPISTKSRSNSISSDSDTSQDTLQICMTPSGTTRKYK